MSNKQWSDARRSARTYLTPEVHGALALSAKRNHRSIAAELAVILERWFGAEDAAKATGEQAGKVA